MSKKFSTRALIFTAISIVTVTVLMAKPASAEPTGAGPIQLPSSITDPNVQVAWIQLYGHTEPISLWDGSTITGRELAQFLLEERIPVVWDVDEVCGGSSCSVKHYTWFGWVFEGQAPGVDPIYLRPDLATNPSGLLMVLAHEIFHRTQPFGAVRDSQFEEYWAFRVGTAISPAVWPALDGYDTMLSNELSRWLRDNNIGAYDRLPIHPPSIDGLVVASAEARPQSPFTQTELQILTEARLIALTTTSANAVLPAWPGQP